MTDQKCAAALADEISTCHVTVRYEGVEDAAELDLSEKTLIVRGLRLLADEPTEAQVEAALLAFDPGFGPIDNAHRRMWNAKMRRALVAALEAKETAR